ncbi:MAG: YkvA family protein [Ectobacillus sp.]
MEQKFSVAAFWSKIKYAAKKAGHLVIYTCLLLFYVLQKPDVPKKTKVAIIGALAYFIAPIDAIPDIAAGIGYTDDLGALGAALIQAAMYVDEDVKQKAKEKLAEWFGNDVDTAEIDKKIEG